MNTEKQCKVCSVVKPFSEYYCNKGRPINTCKICTNVAQYAKRGRLFRPNIRKESDLTKEIADHFLSYNRDTGAFTRSVNSGSERAGSSPGYLRKGDGYLMISVGGREFRAHRLAWLMVYGAFPDDGLVIDHINRVPSDNRIQNLRAVPQKLNAHNICKPKRQNTIGYLGVRLHKGRFTARIYDTTGRETQIGTFDTPEEASAAYWMTKNAMYPEAVIA